MRFGLALSVAGFVLCGSTGAMAQTYYQTNSGMPLYVPSTGAQGYANTESGIPFYNNNAQPLPMDQLVAGKNAPSYNFGGQAQPYNAFGSTTTNSNGVLTPEAVAQMRAARDAQAQQYQQQFLQSGQATSQPGFAAVQNAYNSVTGQQPQQPARPIKRQLVYRQQDNPLAAPPRLFNPDQ